MTQKCFVCKTGHMTQSGSHMYCDKCNFTHFVVTPGYIDACVVLLAELVSNTKFNSRKDVARAVFEHITSHLPHLDNYISTVVNGQEALGGTLLPAIETQAINLQIGITVHNPETAANNLRCQCGSESFHMVSVGKLDCKECTAEYKYQESSGTFQPTFLCKCGSAAWYDEDDHLVLCKSCDKPYMKTILGFQEVSS